MSREAIARNRDGARAPLGPGAEELDIALVTISAT
jgi:hypothetical protein